MPPKKVKISARLSPYNYDLVKAIADVGFLDVEGRHGNFSAALDFCITTLRMNTKFSRYLELVEYKARFDRGERTQEVLDGVREFAKVINIVKSITEN